MRKILILVLGISLFSCATTKQKESALRTQIDSIAQDAKGKVGIAVMYLESGDTLTYNGFYHSPMQSVFKLPIAMCVLNKVDSGKLSLEQKIHFHKADMQTATWSPLRNAFTGTDTDVTINSLLGLMVSNSDNVACDTLISLLGGPQVVNNYMHGIGANGITITVNEGAMHRNTDTQYTNWCEPQQMMYLLYNLYNGKYLSKQNTDLLIKFLQATNTSTKRIKGLLPEGTIVARKSGSSGTYKSGLTPASNDCGIIYLPNGKHMILVAFVSDATASDTVIDRTIARIAKAAYDNACNNKPLQ